MANNTVLAKLAVQITASNAEFSKTLNQTRAEFKSFTSDVQTLGRTLGVTLGATAIFAGLKYAVNVMAEFEAKMSEVKSITGATGKEFEDLKNNALELGASTKFTATQVGELQVAYGRLGFSTKEIINATKATIDLATATGEDLAKSADIVGSTIRSFGLDAKESTRVTDIMASSFNKTALGLENFGEAMKYVAPIAAQAGISIEETTALLGTLSDAGIRGSMAGTSLRKIISDIGGESGTLSEKLKKLADKGLTGAEAMSEVGRTAYASLLVLAKATEKTDALTEAFKNAEGETAKMARTMSDNFSGDVVKLSSAFDGFILSLSNLGPIRHFTQEVTRLFSSMAGGKGAIVSGFEKQVENMGASLVRFGTINKEIIEYLKEQRKQLGQPFDLSVIDSVAKQYNLTKGQVIQLTKALEEVNRALSTDETILKQFNEFSTRNKYTDLTKAADDYIKKINELAFATRVEKGELSKINTDGSFDGEKKRLEETIATYEHVIEVVTAYKETIAKPTDPTAIIAPFKPALGVIESLKEQIKTFQDLQEKSFSPRDVNTYALSIDLLQDKIKKLTTALKEPFVINIKTEKVFTDLGLDELGKKLKLSSEMVSKFQADYVASMNALKGATQSASIEIGGLVSGAISSLAQSLGEAAVGTVDLGKALLQAIGKFAVQFGELLIASGVGTLALQSGNAYAMIAGGAVLVAAGAALSALSKQRQQIGAGSASGGAARSASSSSTSYSSSSGAQDINLTGTSVIKGSDLWIIWNNYNANNKFTKPAGPISG